MSIVEILSLLFSKIILNYSTIYSSSNCFKCANTVSYYHYFSNKFLWWSTWWCKLSTDVYESL